MSVVEVNATNFEDEVIKSDKPVLIDFWASWCGPCKMLSPLVDEFATQQDAVKVCKINVDEEEQLSMKYKVMSIPTLVLIKDGEVANRSVGLISKEELNQFVKG